MVRYSDTESEASRRTFIKGAAATGATVTGLSVFGGSAAAGGSETDGDLNLDVSDVANGLIVVKNVNVLNGLNVNVSDIDVTIGDVSVDVLNFNQLTGDITLDITDNVRNILNNNTTVVNVAILCGDTTIIGKKTYSCDTC